MTAAKEAVVVQGLTRRFGTLTAVDRLSFSVARGRTTGIPGSVMAVANFAKSIG